MKELTLSEIQNLVIAITLLLESKEQLTKDTLVLGHRLHDAVALVCIHTNQDTLWENTAVNRDHFVLLDTLAKECTKDKIFDAKYLVSACCDIFKLSTVKILIEHKLFDYKLFKSSGCYKYRAPTSFIEELDVYMASL
jgi:hypothetical protein